MRRRYLQLFALAAVAVAALVTATAAGGAGGASRTTSIHVTFLNGFEEVNAQGVPGQGDLDGRGVAIVLIDTATDEVCWLLAVDKIEPAFAAHIHQAPRGVNGPIVVPLTAPTSGFSTGCVVDADADAIAANPSGYYVNVHNTPFPGGAVRGQLR